MGQMLMLIGLAGAILSAVGLARGRVWFLRSRKHATVGLVAAFAVFITGGALLPPTPADEAIADRRAPQEAAADYTTAHVKSLGVSSQDIQVRLVPLGFTFQRRADLYGQPHMQGEVQGGAIISLIGPSEALMRIEFTFDVSDNDATNEATTDYIAVLFQTVLKDDAGRALQWVGEQLSAVEGKSVTAKADFSSVTVDVGADPSGYVRIALYPADD